MAFLRMLGLWKTRRQMSADEALNLRNLLILQLTVFLATIVLFYLAAALGARAMSTYVAGVGIGWVICIRYYVWRHVG